MTLVEYTAAKMMLETERFRSERRVAAQLAALDDENHARDLAAEHYDLSWRDRDDG